MIVRDYQLKPLNLESAHVITSGSDRRDFRFGKVLIEECRTSFNGDDNLNLSTSIIRPEHTRHTKHIIPATEHANCPALLVPHLTFGIPSALTCVDSQI